MINPYTYQPEFIRWITDVFSNREIALIAWILFFVAGVFSYRKARKPLLALIRAAFGYHLSKIYLLLLLYLSGLITGLYSIGLWNTNMTKDTLFWLFGVALVPVFKIHKAKNEIFFKNIFFDSIRWTIIVEYIINLTSFSLITELILFPALLFVVLLQEYAKRDPKHQKVQSCFSGVLTIGGICILCISLYKTVVEYTDVLTWNTLLGFIVPPLLTILLIPFLYLLAWWVCFEELSRKIKWITKDENVYKKVRRAAVRAAKFSLTKLHRIHINIEKSEVYDIDAPLQYIRDISKVKPT